MEIVSTVAEWQKIRKGPLAQAKSVGFVPTMGALHSGHASLLERCRAENEISVLSIFVNPTQFDNKNDLAKYPKTYEQDMKLAREHGVDYVIYPTYGELYPDNYRYRVSESGFSQKLCGAHRPGHFDGVLTVVMKLFNLVKPQRAYFGEKDYQQLSLLQDMVSAFFMDLEIVPCPTVREKDGLALSSRNLNLSPEAREKAVLFPQFLQTQKSPAEVRTELENAGFEVDYVEDLNGRRFGAAKIGGVRLIDNVKR